MCFLLVIEINARTNVSSHMYACARQYAWKNRLLGRIVCWEELFAGMNRLNRCWEESFESCEESFESFAGKNRLNRLLGIIV